MPKPEYLVYANDAAPFVSQADVKSWQNNLAKPQYYPYDLFRVEADRPDYFIRGIASARYELIRTLIEDFGAIDMPEEEYNKLKDAYGNNGIILPKNNVLYNNLDYETFYEDPNEGKHHYANTNVPIGWTIASYYAAKFGTAADIFGLGEALDFSYDGTCILGGISVNCLYLYIGEGWAGWQSDGTTIPISGRFPGGYSWGPGLTGAEKNSLIEAGCSNVPTGGGGPALSFETVAQHFATSVYNKVKKILKLGVTKDRIGQGAFDALARMGHSGPEFQKGAVQKMNEGMSLDRILMNPDCVICKSMGVAPWRYCGASGLPSNANHPMDGRSYFDQKLEEYYHANEKTWPRGVQYYVDRAWQIVRSLAGICTKTHVENPTEEYKTYFGLVQPSERNKKLVQTIVKLCGG